MSTNKAILRLFNSILVEKSDFVNDNSGFLERTVRNGYIVDPVIRVDYSLLYEIESIVGISGEKANSAFHKSWSVIKDTPQEELWIQAMVHYITTYGFQSLGMYNDATIYIPNEKFDLPEIKEDIPLTVIKAIDKFELLEQVTELVSSGIALSEETIKDVMLLVESNIIDMSELAIIKNRELKSLCADFYGIIPSEPVEFLRHLISKLTDESLVIKNDYLISKIKESNGKFLDELMLKAPSNLAEIFLRYKPLFLAMKSISKNKTFFNRLRRRAKTLHKPLPEDYLNSITAKLKSGSIYKTVLEKKLENATIFRKIRLAYALQFRKNPGNSIIYKIRNGKGWVTDFDWKVEPKKTEAILRIVRNSIVEHISKNVKDKIIYIPSNVHYTLPATEKQFTGFFPTGSYISVPKDMIVGIHWFNTDIIVDLDLSVISESGKIGWDDYYSSESEDILFSGDITIAPKPYGASELFYLRKDITENMILMLNYYNFYKGDEVNMKLLVASEDTSNFGKNYMVDISNMIASTNINITKKQNILGLIANVEGENRFYFANVSIGNSITSTVNERSNQVREYLVNSLINSIDLKDILELAGATVVDKKPVITPTYKDYIDLSPEALDKTTIINLIN